MMKDSRVTILSFYEFKDLQKVGDLEAIKAALKDAMITLNVRGTIILANEGYNGMICGIGDDIKRYVQLLEAELDTNIVGKRSFAERAPFRKTDVRIKKEIVTLKKDVDLNLGADTHIDPKDWNTVISDPTTFVLDARNDYEFQTGSFKGAVNPGILKFSELPAYVGEHLDPAKHKRVAMFCTGGIRCEKFAPYLKELGFDEVFQLQGGILNYLETVSSEESLWSGECFVFDERISVDADLNKGSEPDRSQRRKRSIETQLEENR